MKFIAGAVIILAAAVLWSAGTLALNDAKNTGASDMARWGGVLIALFGAGVVCSGYVKNLDRD